MDSHACIHRFNHKYDQPTVSKLIGDGFSKRLAPMAKKSGGALYRSAGGHLFGSNGDMAKMLHIGNFKRQPTGGSLYRSAGGAIKSKKPVSKMQELIAKSKALKV